MHLILIAFKIADILCDLNFNKILYLQNLFFFLHSQMKIRLPPLLRHQLPHSFQKSGISCLILSKNMAPVAPMPQKSTGARHPWHPSLRGPCLFNIIPKSLVTLQFLKFLIFQIKAYIQGFQMRYQSFLGHWYPNSYS